MPALHERRRAGRCLAALAAAALWLAACAGPAGTPTPAAAPDETRAAEDAAGKAVNDLSQRLQVAPAAIEVDAVEPHTWPDTSLGLPEPGQAYAQVVTSGYIVRLGYARQAYVYHVAGDIVRLDQAASAPVPSAPAP